MDILSLLTTSTGFNIDYLSGVVSIGWLEYLIKALITGVGITGIGIILYCLILKVVTLPLDVWQKASMRRQNLKMESMRGQLEKLKAQYSNNPELYQKKMQEIYKQNNYNMFSSCIPMIAMLVILIIAFQSLTTYSQYMNLQIYVDMSNAYNNEIMRYYDDDASIEEVWSRDDHYTIYRTDESDTVHFVYKVSAADDVFYCVDNDKLVKISNMTDAERKELGLDSLTFTAPLTGENDDCLTYVKQNIGGKKAAEVFEGEMNNYGASFLLTKNIFYADVAWAHPIADYSSFCSSITREITILDSEGKETDQKVKIGTFISQETYGDITCQLTERKSEVNGFFILVALTIIANLGSQFLTMRSQKAQRELQTADKSQQSMQKWMTFLMPVLLCIFAFIYSGAFSLYLITSSVFSTLSTLVVNKIIDSIYKKRAMAESKKVLESGRIAYSRDWDKNEQLNKEKNKNKK